eukprot:ANDGO_06907.mRNA.1 hypothetical protein
MTDSVKTFVCEAKGWDGCPLHVTVHLPPQAKGLVLCGHAMAVDSRTMYRPPTTVTTSTPKPRSTTRETIGSVLLKQGFGIALHESRNRRQSGLPANKGGCATYEDYVHDVGSLVDCICEHPQLKHLPLATLGHSQFAHVVLAYLSMSLDPRVKAHVMFGGNAWVKRYETSTLKWMLKVLIMVAVQLCALIVGYVPFVRLGMGTCDESALFWSSFLRFNWRDEWCTDRRAPEPVHGKNARRSNRKNECPTWTQYRSRFGTDSAAIRNSVSSLDFDYAAHLSEIKTPVLAVFSSADTLECKTEQGILFSAAVPNRSIVVCDTGMSKLDKRDVAAIERARMDGHSVQIFQTSRLNHMGLLTSAGGQPVWEYASTWIHATVLSRL